MPSRLLAVCAALAGVFAASAGQAVPPRHHPQKIMGRDYWPALYKYGDWVSSAGANAVRFDNPAINDLPAFRDAAPVYHARRTPPPEESGKATWRMFADNFRAQDRDGEIVSSNPHPDRPLFLWVTSKRPCVTLGGEIDLAGDDFAAWKAARPNLQFDGIVVEWDNDLMLAYPRAGRIADPLRRAQVEAFLGKPPADRYGRMQMMRRHFANRTKAHYNGKMAVFVAHIYNLHLGADAGARYLTIETTNTSGSPTNDNEYRWNTAAFFARGAARQFALPWEWYFAAYMNGFCADGSWLNNAMCAYPASASGYSRIEYGTSANLMRRGYYFAYLNGANVTQVEEWSAQYQAWDEAAGKTVLTQRGRDYSDFHDFTQRCPKRGVVYAPVAVCVPLSQGYSAYGGWPWAEYDYGYTQGDHAVDAVFFTLVPGFERAKAMKKGVETNLHNSPFAQMYDVICPDAPSQSEEQTLEVLKSYRALVVAGDFKCDKTERCLAAYAKSGGRVIRLGPGEVPPPGRSAVRDTLAGRKKFPAVERIFRGLERDYFPLAVEGDCLYGMNKTPSGWWLWVFNNKGVVKFADRPHTVDKAFDATVTVSPAHFKPVIARELLSGRRVAVSGGRFTWRVPAGDLAVFELEGK